jgi:predicted O-methyltransferase YrrM
MTIPSSIAPITLPDLAKRLGYPPPPPFRHPGWAAWRTEVHDASILRYLYEHHRPTRHLEFGTWQGFGTCLCLESCAATVWTLNLPDGESKPDGSWAYGERVLDETNTPPGAVTANYGADEAGPRTYHRTDAASYIGRLYREKQLGHRVCQIYCDSRNWATSAYPPAFFDSVFIDGGHQADVVINDTRKALPLLRSGGILLWHDFTLEPAVVAGSAPMQGVVEGINALLPELTSQFSSLSWVNPSYLLLGIKK